MKVRIALAGLVCVALMSVALVQAQVPVVTATSPMSNTASAAATTAIVVTFSTDMNYTTINGTTIVVHARQTGYHTGVATYDIPTRSATFTMSRPFATGEQVTVTLTTGIRSAGGSPLARPYVWSFIVDVTAGSGEFAPHFGYIAGDTTYAVCVGDFNLDGRMDIAAANAYSNTVNVYFNQGWPWGFTFPATVATGERPRGIAAGDVDRDGDIDLVTANEWANTATVLRNDGFGAFSLMATVGLGIEPRDVALADMDGDGDLEIVSADALADSVTIRFNNGSGGFPTSYQYYIGNGPVSVFPADLDGDHDLDIATANWGGSGVLAVAYNNGSGVLTAPTFVGYGGTIDVIVADVNGDTCVDLVAAGNGPDAAMFTYNLGNGTFHESADELFSVAGYPNAIFAADIDNDGDLDCGTASSFVYLGHTVSVLLNDGSGMYFGRIDYDVDYGPFDIVAADFDEDGDMDLVTANIADGNISILMNTGGSCCEGDAGNVNDDALEQVDLSDLIFLVNFLFLAGAEPPCMDEANINGDPGCAVDLSDLIHLVNFLFLGGPGPAACLTCD